MNVYKDLQKQFNDADGYLYEKILNSQIISQERLSIEIPDDVFERICNSAKEK